MNSWKHGAAIALVIKLRRERGNDLLQELLVRLSRSDGFGRADNPLLYARRAAIHLAFDWHRRKNRSAMIDHLPQEPAAAAADCLNVLVAREDFDRVLTGMKELSAFSRTCLVLHYIEHLSYAEIAGQLGKTPHQICGLCHKGIRQLQRLMGVATKEGDC